MKLLTILVDNRTDHVIDFDSISPVSNSYILTNMAKPMSIFAFHMHSGENPGIILQTDEGMKMMYLTHLEEVNKVQEGYECSLKLKVSLSYRASETNHMQASPIWNRKRQSVQYLVEKDVTYKIEVEFALVGDDSSAAADTASIFLNIVPQSQIYDVVLDYGSESSQMLIVNRNETATMSNIAPLFTLFRTQCAGGDPIDEREDSLCLQFDSDAYKAMMKSVFFVSRRPDPSQISVYKPFEEDGVIHFITDVREVEELSRTHFIMPNVKIAGFGGVSLPTVTDANGIPEAVNIYRKNYFYRRTVNAFIYQAMRYISKDNKPVYMNLCLLTPNVYRQDQLTQNLYNAFVAVNEIATHNQEVAHVKGVEVSSASESDASLLGFINTLPPAAKTNMGKGRYLILDAGKGTLDFSVLDYQPENAKNQFASIFRAGLIGAGNALTYAFFMSIMRYLYKSFWNNVSERQMNDDIAEFVATKLTSSSADSALLCRLLHNLEKYKIMYSSGTLNPNATVSLPSLGSFDNFTLVALNNCIDQIVCNAFVIDDFSCVTNMMEMLAREAALKFRLSYNDDPKACIEYIVFAGRTFKMKQFREAVVKAFKEINPVVCDNMQEKPLSMYGADTAATYKNCCLFVLEPLREGRYNGKLVGVPKILRYMSQGQYQLQDQTDMIGTTPKVEDDQSIKIRLKRWLDDVGEYLKETFSLNSEDVYVNNDLSNPLNVSSSELVYGFPLYINSLADLIVISGIAYPIPPHMLAKDHATVFFNGVDFEIRQRNGLVGKLVPPPALSAGHVFESMFPYLELATGQPLPLPSDKTGVYNPLTGNFSGKDNAKSTESELENYGAEDDALLKGLKS